MKKKKAHRVLRHTFMYFITYKYFAERQVLSPIISNNITNS